MAEDDRQAIPEGLVDGLTTLVDRQAIVDVLNRYAECIDGKAWAMLDQVFVDGADCDFSPLGEAGHRAPFPEITEWLEASLAGFSTQHILSNHQVEVDGDTARTRTYLQAQHVYVDADPPRLMTFGGVYEDQFERTANGWRIVQRTLRPMWFADEPAPA